MSVENIPASGRKIKKPNYIQKLLSSLRTLWSAQEVLRLSNIRMGYLHYIVAFPMALIFVNTQGSLLTSYFRVFGLPTITVSFISFAVGATVMFIIKSVENIHIVSKISSILTLTGFIPWLFLPPDGYPAFICTIVFMAGIGCCMATSDLSFMFVLNNAERFFGCVFTALFIGIVNTNAEFIRQYLVVRTGLITILVIGISVCMYKTRGSDFTEISNRSFQGFDPSIWLALFILLSYFIIRILGFYVPEFHIQLSPPLRNVLAFAPALLCIIVHLAFRRSVWIMCNLFFISAIMCYVMGFAQMLNAAYIFAILKEIGLFAGFYLLACVINKFCDFRKHQIVSLICILTIGTVFVVPDILIHTALTHTVAVTVSAGLFVVFLLLSPAFSLYLFNADWSQEFAKLYMSEIKEQVALVQNGELNPAPDEKDDLLTPEERDVALLLIEGETRRDISRRLHMNTDDVDQQLNSIRDKVIRKSGSDPVLAAIVREYGLTRRETDMLRCLCRGMTNAEIAAELFLSEGTVRIHVRNLLKKLPVGNRRNIAAWMETFGEKKE